MKASESVIAANPFPACYGNMNTGAQRGFLILYKGPSQVVEVTIHLINSALEKATKVLYL